MDTIDKIRFQVLKTGESMNYDSPVYFTEEKIIEKLGADACKQMVDTAKLYGYGSWCLDDGYIVCYDYEYCRSK